LPNWYAFSAITSPSKSVGGAEIGGIRLEFSQRTTLNEAVAAVRIAERLLNGDQG
jgi:hypothetical protein